MNNASSAFVIPCLVISLLNISYDKYMYDVNEMNMKLCFTLCLFDHMTMEGGPGWGRLADQEMAANPIKISSKTEKQGILWTLDINTGILYQICVDWGKSYDHYITLISTNFQDRPQNWKLCWQTSPSKIPHCCLHQSEARKLSSWPELTNRRAGWRVHHLGKGWLWWWWHCSSSNPPPPPHPPTSSNCWHSFEQNFRVLRTFDSNDD